MRRLIAHFVWAVPVLLAVSMQAQSSVIERAQAHYQRTEYRAALDLLEDSPSRDAAALLLAAKCHYMAGEFKKASDTLEGAVRLKPGDSVLHMWLGRAYGRRAETSSFLTAPGLASKARGEFERAVALNPVNKEAVSDLFEYYTEAPGFLGGGTDKALALAEKHREADAGEYHYRLAQLARKRKDFDAAEDHLRKALEAEPRGLGRHIDLAAFLSRQGRHAESDALFQRAAEMEPDSPRLMFARARAFVEAKRNLDLARVLLERYLKAPLTPDDPPRAEAEALLRRARSG